MPDSTEDYYHLISSFPLDDDDDDDANKSVDKSYVINEQEIVIMDDDDDDEVDKFKILDPNDPLMTRFQEALKSHLNRVNERLTNEIDQLEIDVKSANKIREDEAVTLYDVQQEVNRQETAVENYKDMLAELIDLRSNLENRLTKAKEIHKTLNDELEMKKNQGKNLIRTVESLDALQRQFVKWENELTNDLLLSQRVADKDGEIERDLLLKKQQRDYVLYKLEDEVWRLQAEVKDLDEQLLLKDSKKACLGQKVADANADLDGLKKEHKTLYNAWNSVLNLINQRDQIYDEINMEQRKICDTLNNLETQIVKLEKDSAKEMENNERLTSLQTRISEEIQITKKFYENDKDRYLNLENNFIKSTKLLEQNDKEFNTAVVNYESIVEEEKILNKQSLKIYNEKRNLEDEILAKLDDKVTQDKVIKHLNKLLHEAKDTNLENELNLTRFENMHGKSLLELEKYNSILEDGKYDLDVLTRKNIDKEKETNDLQAEVKNYESLFLQKERKVVGLNKKIEELLAVCSSKEESPLDSKITLLEKNIVDTDKKIKEAQKFWFRQQGFVFSLSKQRDTQLQELSVVAKEIILMDQKNLKLEAELERQKKEEISMNKAINALQQKLLQINTRLASQKEFKNKLEDQNDATKNEYLKSLEDAELELIKLENDIKQIVTEKFLIKDELKCTQRESLSWENKVQSANETNKSYKEERNSGGDVAIMKSEIHKMEIRLSYLRRAQEKLIQDMEYCISRRDNIMDEAIAREKKNPRSQHNQKIILRKRLDDQRNKVKQIIKEIKQIDNKKKIVETEQKKLLEYLTEGQKLLRQNEDIVPDIEKQILETELIKHHNLEILVRKQRRANMLRDLKTGRYKSLTKSETILNQEWQIQQDVNKKLNEIMQQTEHDFPLLKNQIRKILLTLKNN